MVDRSATEPKGGMSATLAVAEPKVYPSYTDAEMRARSILSRLDSVAAKLKTLEDDIRLLWADFDNLKPGETILGCATKKEFCEKKLHRTPRAIQYMLAGQSNPADRPRSELSSPQAPQKPLSPEPIEHLTGPKPKDDSRKVDVHPLEALQRHISSLRPALTDRNGGDNEFVRVLASARLVPITDDRRELAKIVVKMMNELLVELSNVRDEIKQNLGKVR